MRSQILGVTAQVMVMAIIISVILLFVGIGVLIFIHVCIVGRAFRRGLGNDNNMVNRHRFGSKSMSRDDTERLPSFDFNAKCNSKGSSPVDCAVCLENFKAGDKCRLLPLCNHSFHAQCVDSWLLRAPICPMCRTSTAESGRFSGSGIELRGNQTDGSLNENVVEWRDAQTDESGHSVDTVIELIVET